MVDMPMIKKQLARKAVRSTAKHTTHGTAATLKREPVRTATLLAFGAAIGALAGWMIARTGGDVAVSEAPQT